MAVKSIRPITNGQRHLDLMKVEGLTKGRPEKKLVKILKKKSILEEKINNSVFPGMQGGPHNNKIAAIATQLREVMTEEFENYMITVLSNSKKLCRCLQEMNYFVPTRGTDCHLFLLDLKNKEKFLIKN